MRTYTHAEVHQLLAKIYNAPKEEKNDVLCSEALKYDIFVWELEPSQDVSKSNDLQRRKHESIRHNRHYNSRRSLTIED